MIPGRRISAPWHGSRKALGYRADTDLSLSLPPPPLCAWMSGCLLSVNAKEPGCTRDASERALGVERGLLDLHPYWHLTTQQKALWKLPDHALRSNLLLLGASLCVRASAAVPLPVAVRPPSLLPVIFGKWVCRVLLSLGKRLLRRSPRLPTAASRWLWWRWGGMTTGTRRQSAKEPPSNARARVFVCVWAFVCASFYTHLLSTQCSRSLRTHLKKTNSHRYNQIPLKNVMSQTRHLGDCIPTAASCDTLNNSLQYSIYPSSEYS